MAFPDDIPGLFDNLINDLDSATDFEEGALQAPLKTDETEVLIEGQDDLNSSCADADATAFPSASSAPDGFLRLSEILGKIELPERTYIVDHYEDAVRRGVIQAVPLTGQSFQVRYWQDEKPTRRTVQDELILRTPEMEEWLRVQRLESRYAYRAATRNAATSLEHLQSGRDDFQRLAKLRRQLLSTKGKEKE